MAGAEDQIAIFLEGAELGLLAFGSVRFLREEADQHGGPGACRAAAEYGGDDVGSACFDTLGRGGGPPGCYDVMARPTW